MGDSLQCSVPFCDFNFRQSSAEYMNSQADRQTYI